MLARAFETNPLHVAMFRRDVLRRNETFFAQRIRSSFTGTWLTAVQGVRVVGVAHWSRDLGDLASLSRLGSVLLGPIGVLPEQQGRGVGRRLMEQYCQELDERGEAGVLETEVPSNLAFYRMFAFDTVNESERHGILRFTMVRPALMTP